MCEKTNYLDTGADPMIRYRFCNLTIDSGEELPLAKAATGAEPDLALRREADLKLGRIEPIHQWRETSGEVSLVVGRCGCVLLALDEGGVVVGIPSYPGIDYEKDPAVMGRLRPTPVKDLYELRGLPASEQRSPEVRPLSARDTTMLITRNMFVLDPCDKGRLESLRQLVTKDSVVIDLGAGTGVFGLLACRFGARRVYAIDPNDAIAVAEEFAAANGFIDRFVCIQDLSTSVELPERADLIWGKVSARFVGGDYVWRWQTRVGSGDGTARLELDQSDFFGMPRGRETLRRGRAEHAPELDLDGQIDRFILDSMDGVASLQEIAQRVAGRYPESFDNPGDALSRVAKLSLRYGK